MSTRTVIPHLFRAISERQTVREWQRQSRRRVASQALRAKPSNKPQPFSRMPVQSPPVTEISQPPKNWPAQLADVQDSKEARKVSVMFKVTLAFGFAVGIYCTYFFTSWTQSVKAHAMSDEFLPFNADVSNRWKQLGRDFDDEVELSEKLMRMKNKRHNLVRRAYGNVLEVSVGTGRNLDYYDLRSFSPADSARRNIVTHLTLNDQSNVIIAAAEKKMENIMSRQEKTTQASVNFVVGDAGVSGVIARPEGGYDTIVQTMGVCSMVDPVGFLRKMGRLCRQPGEVSKTPPRWREQEDDGKGGQILLLEHGRGHFDWLNWILDTGASLHAHQFGCWWNKDIEQIVEQSGLEVERIKRYHGGTTWMIVLRPKVQEETRPTDTQIKNLQQIPKRRLSWFGKN